jgi:hypothetical protein
LVGGGVSLDARQKETRSLKQNPSRLRNDRSLSDTGLNTINSMLEEKLLYMETPFHSVSKFSLSLYSFAFVVVAFHPATKFHPTRDKPQTYLRVQR